MSDTMSMDVCRDLIHHLLGDLEIGHAPKDVQSWLETLGLEIPFLRFLQWNWPQESGALLSLELHSSREIREHADTERLLPHKLLNVGSASNGDLLVLDFSTPAAQPGFVSHDKFWEDPEADPRTCLQPIARTLASLLWRISEGRYVAADYYAAQALNTFLEEERNAGS